MECLTQKKGESGTAKSGSAAVVALSGLRVTHVATSINIQRCILDTFIQGVQNKDTFNNELIVPYKI